jgi:hypothetical protein
VRNPARLKNDIRKMDTIVERCLKIKASACINANERAFVTTIISRCRDEDYALEEQQLTKIARLEELIKKRITESHHAKKLEMQQDKLQKIKAQRLKVVESENEQ